MKTKIVLISIIILAAALRFYQLGAVPVGLFGDEVDAGYNAYSFMKTGKDYNGNFFPIHSESMGDYRPAGFFISLIPSIAILGLSDLSVRLMPALYGILSVYLIYLLTNKLLNENKFTINNKKLKIGLLSAILLAITPWHIHFSRVALDVGLTVTLLLLGTYTFLKALSSKSKRSFFWLFFSSATFALNSYSYQVAKLYSPLLLFILIWVYRKKLWQIPKKYLFISLAVFTILLTPLATDTLSGSGQSRFNSISILNNEKTTQEINIARGQLPNLPTSINRILHNKVISIGYLFIDNYLDAFSFNFLFTSGDINNPRHSIPGFGLFYLWMAPLFIWGIVELWKQKSQLYPQFIFLWLLTAPIPSALTINGGNHAIRLFIMLPPIIIISAIGTQQFFQYIKQASSRPSFWSAVIESPWNKKIIPFVSRFLLIVIPLISSTYFIQRYFRHYSLNNHQHWQYGLEPAIKFAQSVEDSYDQIIITKSFVHLPILYYLFYTQYDPATLHQQFKDSNSDPLSWPTELIDKYRFATINPDDTYNPPNTLYIAAPGDRAKGWKQIRKIKSPDPTDDKPILIIQKSETLFDENNHEE